MKNFFFLVVLLIMSSACSNRLFKKNKIFNSVKIDTLFFDKISIRAISIDNERVYFASDKNSFGYFDLISGRKNIQKLTKDDLEMEFRSIAQTKDYVFILSIGNPAVLYKISKKDNSRKIVYQENNLKVFYDSMRFYNDLEGFAVGDPTEDCLSIIKTTDGGNSWHKISCNEAPKVIDGEAAFAASNTNIVIKNNNTWIVSGGKRARVFYSKDKFKTFEIVNTPIIQGQTMTGIFTADFCDNLNGIVAGGNYEKLLDNFDNKAITNDGGKSWRLVAQNQGFGYASCVQYAPNTNGKTLVCVGATGVFCSHDKALTWSKLLDLKEIFTLRFINNKVAIAGGKNCLLKLTFH